jgi:hypothetical protein
VPGEGAEKDAADAAKAVDADANRHARALSLVMVGKKTAKILIGWTETVNRVGAGVVRQFEN